MNEKNVDSPVCGACGSNAVGWYRGVHESPPRSLEEQHMGIRRFEADEEIIYFCAKHDPERRNKT